MDGGPAEVTGGSLGNLEGWHDPPISPLRLRACFVNKLLHLTIILLQFYILQFSVSAYHHYLQEFYLQSSKYSFIRSEVGWNHEIPDQGSLSFTSARSSSIHSFFRVYVFFTGQNFNSYILWVTLICRISAKEICKYTQEARFPAFVDFVCTYHRRRQTVILWAVPFEWNDTLLITGKLCELGDK